MVRTINILSKSSILQSIIDMEEKLSACEDEAQKLADEKLAEAKKDGEEIVEKAKKELPVIEKGGGKRTPRVGRCHC